jgi:hypothetical protein
MPAPYTSTVPVFKHQLLVNLQARVGLNGVQITHGPPFPLPEPEFIWLADVDGHQDWAAINVVTKPKEETYDLTVWIKVLRSTTPDDFKTAGDRAFALMAEIEQELRGDPSVANTVRVAHVGAYKFTEDANAEFNEAILRITVHVRARI